MPACPRPGVYAPRQTHDCDAAELVRRHLPGFLFRLELTADELVWLVAHQGEARGSYPGERCHVEVRRVGDLLGGDELDWSTLGMLLAGLRDP